MVAAKKRYPLALAELTGEAVTRLLKDSCDRVEIAGSIRRRMLDVGDIELLCIPSAGQTDLFGAPLAAESQLETRVRDLIGCGVLTYRLNALGRRTYGPKNKLLVHKSTGIPVDVFSTDEANWGMAMFVRTGPAEFVRDAMARFREMGMEGHAYGGVTKEGVTVACPAEEKVFELLEWEYLPPEARGLQRRRPGMTAR